MKLNTIYTDSNNTSEYYFKYILNDTEILLEINLATEVVEECSNCLEVYADTEVTDESKLIDLRNLVTKYFIDRFKYYDNLADKYYSLSIGEFLN